MKVLFYIHSLNKGGAEKVLLTIVNELNKSNDYDTVILTDTIDELEYDLPADIRRIVLNGAVFDGRGIKESAESFGQAEMASFERIRLLRKTIKNENPDKVVVFMLSAVIRAAIALIGIRIPIIGSVRSNPYADYDNVRSRIIFFWVMRKLSIMVCQTEYQAEFFSAIYRNKCVIISNPVFGDFADKAQQLSDEGNGIRINSVDTGEKLSKNTESNSIIGKIVATGRLFDYKNHKLLIRAFKKIADGFPNITVVIFGEGPYRGELETEIEKLKLGKKVFLPGDSSQVAEDISDALIYVLPSDTEGLPNALMEAMALRLPVIATDCPCGGPKSLIEDGVNGLLVPVGDIDAMAAAIKRLLSDEELRKKLGEKAGNILNTNSIEIIVKQWKSFL